MEKSLREKGKPILYYENDRVFYGLLNLPIGIVCLGPVTVKKENALYADRYFQSHGLETSEMLKHSDNGRIVKLLMLIAYHFTGQMLSYDDFSLCGASFSVDSWHSSGELEHYQLVQSEYERDPIIGVDYEKELMRLVTAGDTEAVKKLMGGPQPDMDMIGELALSSSRQTEYNVVSLITLLSRAAIDGGVSPRTAHELGAVYLRQLDRNAAKDEAVMMIGLRAMAEFAELVRRTKEQQKTGSAIIKDCKSYVEKNLRKDLQVSEIGHAIGVSRSYLAHKFKEVEGVTLQQYIQRERCRHAANLLQYSDYSLPLIAEYMCFPSQSYFGSCFKRWYGMTPKAYREKMQKK